MAKGDDAVRRKKNRVNRKRLRGNDSSSKVSARVAAIIASKQRRKSGKRRICEGMCFSLPTPEDPFNDRDGPKSWNKKKANELDLDLSNAGVYLTEKVAAPKTKISDRSATKFEEKQREPKTNVIGNGKVEHSKVVSVVGNDKKNHADTGKSILGKGGVIQAQGLNENFHGSLKFLSLCLQAIQNALKHECSLNDYMDRPLLFNVWGLEFWKCCRNGLDILETSGACCSIEQIAWIVSTATDLIVSLEKKGQSLACPFLLFLVPSQEKAIEVRSVCKPLKEVGIHTVSLHAGASLDHQIQGLKTCEPEFLISTPERLLELISLRAIDISELSLLVVDGLETFVRDGLLDKIKFIKQSIRENHVTVVFNNGLETVPNAAVQDLMKEPIRRLSLGDSIKVDML